MDPVPPLLAYLLMIVSGLVDRRQLIVVVIDADGARLTPGVVESPRHLGQEHSGILGGIPCTLLSKA